MGRVRSPKRRVRDDILGYRRIIVESSFYWRKHSGSFRWNLELQDFVAGAVFGEVGGWLYLLHALEMTFESDADHWWHSFCVAGAVFGEVGGWLYCVQALEMMFHMWRRSLMTFILHGAVFGEVAGCLYCLHALEMRFHMWRRSAELLFGEVPGWFCLLRVLDMKIHMWCGSLMTLILCGRRSIWWGWRVTFRGRRTTSWHFGR